MKKAIIISLISTLSLSFSSTALDGKSIFTCIKDEDFLCVAKEAAASEDWQFITNDDNETPLIVAIKTRNQQIIKALVNFGAPVSREEVLFAMKTFFDLPLWLFDDANSPRAISSLPAKKSVVENMLFAATREEQDGIEPLLAESISLFATKSKLAKYIANIIANGQMKPPQAKALLRNYTLLFLQDRPLTLETMMKVVDQFLRCEMHRYLLLLIVDNYCLLNQSPLKAKNQKIHVRRHRLAHEVAVAIYEKSRAKFLAFSIKDLMRRSLLSKPNQAIDDAETFYNELIRFVTWSVHHPQNIQGQEYNYNFWLHVYNRLLKHGDLASAMSLAIGLSVSKVHKDDLPLAGLDKNFSGYRQKLLSMDHPFIIPSLIVLERDLESTRELGLFIKHEDGTMSLNTETLKFCRRLRREYANYINNDAPHYRTDTILNHALGQLTETKLNGDNGSREYVYQTLFPRSISE